MFVLDQRLQADTLLVGALPLSQVLLMNDSQYPWCILVPRREAITEIHQLDEQDRVQLLNESCLLASVMETLFRPDKMNVAAIGNMVSQLHLHHIARFQGDKCWPKPVWGQIPAMGYTDNAGVETINRLRCGLEEAGQELS